MRLPDASPRSEAKKTAFPAILDSTLVRRPADYPPNRPEKLPPNRRVLLVPPVLPVPAIPGGSVPGEKRK